MSDDTEQPPELLGEHGHADANAVGSQVLRNTNASQEVSTRPSSQDTESAEAMGSTRSSKDFFKAKNQMGPLAEEADDS